MAQLTDDIVASMAPTDGALGDARGLLKKGALQRLARSDDGKLVFADCKGSARLPYAVSLDFAGGERPTVRCSCPSRQRPCKHGLALALTLVARPAAFAVAPPPAERLECISGEGDLLDDDDDTGKEDSADGSAEAAGEEDTEDDPSSLLEEERRRAREMGRFPFRSDPRWGDVALRLLANRTLLDDAEFILGHLRDQRARKPLLARLRRGGGGRWLGEALAAVSDQATVAAAIKLIEHPEAGDAACHFLGLVRSSAAVEPLLARLTKVHLPTWGVLGALERIGDPRAAVPLARRLLRRDVLHSAGYTLRALWQLDSPDALPALRTARAKRAREHGNPGPFDALIAHLERPRR